MLKHIKLQSRVVKCWSANAWITLPAFGQVYVFNLVKAEGEDPFLFQHDCVPVHNVRSVMEWLGEEFGLKELGWALRDLCLIKLFGMNQNGDLSHLVQHQCLSSQMPFQINEESYLQNTLKNIVKSLPRRVEGIRAAKTGNNSILMPMDLEWDSFKK